jgi:surface antigen Omp85-like protein
MNVVLRLTMVSMALLAATRAADAQAPEERATSETSDVIDVLRGWFQGDQAEPRAAFDPTSRMVAFAPVIGYKPESKLILGAAGNVAYFRGDPLDTRISSGILSATITTEGQTAINFRYGHFARGDRWKVDGDNRFQWTSQNTYGLGAATQSSARVNAKYDFFRVYNSVYRAVQRGVFVGAGLHFNTETNVRPRDDMQSAWSTSGYIQYSELHDLPLDSQTSGGVSASIMYDTRDNPINADRGSMANVSYRPFFKGFLGGDTNWQELSLDARTYVSLSTDRRHKLAFWFWGDLVTTGVAPYFDLPAIGMDTYGRSGRGYGEGRYRGERLVYGEVEYRGPLSSTGLLGWVAFLNTTTLTNLQEGERLFDNFAPGAGAGLRLLFNKHSRTNICFDLGFGKDGSRGVYLAVQEAF